MAEEEKELSKAEKKALKKQEKEEKKKAKKAGKEGPDGEGQDEDEGGVGGKIIVALVALMIIAVWLVIFGLLIKMDVGGFGSTVLYPVLKDVPVINQILPESEEYAEEDSAYQFSTVDEAVARIKELEQQLADAQSSNDATAAEIADLQAQAAELQTYKENEAAFEETKEKFYEEVVYNDNAPDIDTYKEYYESIEPDNAAAIYKQVVEQEQTSQEISDYVAAYSAMDPSAAAKIFDSMTDNLSLVAEILENMSSQARGDILAAMDTDTAAQVTEMMQP
ncbi:hypothetical protein SAMN02910453_0284 [Lachnospiraceae bacterium A10]|jgi:flagellar motility protein MotE (MotC chaperone)|nr:hypothetical protein SAMN02910453_0284 [Lachnospiraceae bacterium A10]